MARGKWKNHSEDWPNGMRPCTSCKDMLPFSAFHKHAQCMFGVNTVCRVCRREKNVLSYDSKPSVAKMYWRAKSRSILLNREFSICVEDIHMPDRCPVLGVPFSQESGSPFVPSLDRIDSTKGYTPKNIMVITRRANQLKNNGTLQEFEAIVRFMKQI